VSNTVGDTFSDVVKSSTNNEGVQPKSGSPEHYWGITYSLDKYPRPKKVVKYRKSYVARPSTSNLQKLKENGFQRGTPNPPPTCDVIEKIYKQGVDFINVLRLPFFVRKIITQLILVTFWLWQKDFGKKSTFIQITCA
jgi:hypothetical protein